MDRLLNRLTHAQAMLLIAAGVLIVALPAAAADAAHGKSVFASQCAMCHSSSRNGPTILGPPLFSVVGRKAGTNAGFAYSPGMKAAGFAWSDERLHAYLPAPRAMVPGTKMTYGGLKNPAQLDDLLAYLDSLK
jgi:cytochrome c